MACPFNLRDALGGTPNTTGNWVPGAPNGGDCTDIVNTNPAAITITGGHLGTISTDNAPVGTYQFTYIVGASPCIECATVTVTVNQGTTILFNNTYCTADVNGNVECNRTLCDGDNTAYNLYTEFVNGTNTTNASWDVDPAPAGYVPGTASVLDDTFNPDTAGVGTYQFIYTLNNGDGTTPVGCTNCVKTAVINITVDAQPNAGTNGNVTLCNDL